MNNATPNPSSEAVPEEKAEESPGEVPPQIKEGGFAKEKLRSDMINLAHSKSAPAREKAVHG